MQSGGDLDARINHLQAELEVAIALQMKQNYRETENDDLRSVMQKIVCTSQVLESCDAGDEKIITEVGLLNTMQILAVMEERTEVHVAHHPAGHPPHLHHQVLRGSLEPLLLSDDHYTSVRTCGHDGYVLHGKNYV